MPPILPLVCRARTEGDLEWSVPIDENMCTVKWLCPERPQGGDSYLLKVCVWLFPGVAGGGRLGY